MGLHLKGTQHTGLFQQSYLLRESAYRNGFSDLLTLLSTPARGKQQYTLSRRIILFSDIDVHIPVTVTLLVLIYLSALKIILKYAMSARLFSVGRQFYAEVWLEITMALALNQ